MKPAVITTSEFEERLAAVCLAGTGSTFPRRVRDRHILYRSIVQGVDRNRKYTEPALNEALKQWLSGIGTCIDIDHVTLRRYLVDEGYLSRDSEGSLYTVNLTGRAHIEFEKAVTNIDPAVVVQSAKARIAARKQAIARPESEK